MESEPVLKVKRGWVGSLYPQGTDRGGNGSLSPQNLDVRTSHTHTPHSSTLKVRGRIKTVSSRTELTPRGQLEEQQKRSTHQII